MRGRIWRFQSTLPQGERLTHRTHTSRVSNFNPRSHKGSDKQDAYTGEFSVISIHAPTRGATAYAPQGRYLYMDFNPRSHKGSDRWTGRKACPFAQFQSTLPQGERPYNHLGGSSLQDFNPRSHKGSDVITGIGGTVTLKDFNPRSHKGSDSVGKNRFRPHALFQSTLPQGERPFR